MLKELFCESFKENGKIRETIKFHEGLNIVVGDKKDGEIRNSIGKSSFLLILDYVFGGENYKKSEAYKYGDQIFKYSFIFKDIEYHFIRTNKKDDVFICNSHYIPKETLKLSEYKSFLKEKYELNEIELSFRKIVSPYSRVFTKGKNITPGNVLESFSNQKDNPVRIFEKLCKVYYKIKEKDDKISLANAKKKILKNARREKIQLEENEQIDVKKVKNDLESLEQEKENLINNQSENFKNLDEEKIARIIEATKQLSTLQKKRTKLFNRKNTILINLEDNRHPAQVSFDELLEFFPEANIKHLEEIESFHSKLTSILEDEYKASLSEIENSLSEIYSQIELLQKELMELEKDNGNYKLAFLKKFSEIENKIRDCKLKLEKAEAKKQEAKELKELNEQLSVEETDLLSALSEQLNKELEINSSDILEQDINSVKINFPSTKSYTVSIQNDDGTGSTYASDIIFDLTILSITTLPFLIHDSYLFANIRGKKLDRIITKYNSIAKKQIFISIDEIEKLEQKTQDIISKQKILTLYAGGGELFGESWNKNNIK